MIRAYLTIAAAAGLILAGCTTNPQTGQTQVSQTAVGAAIGAVGGAGVGYLTGGDDDDDARRNALIGAGIGALAGGAVGNYLANQETALDQAVAGSGAQVQRQGDVIVVNMPGNVTFATDSAQINPAFQSTLDGVASTLNQYPQSYVDITGHTDSTGTLAYNMQLSDQRARAIADYLVSRGVNPARILVRGVGPNQPVADNNTATGRQANRRVSLEIRPFTA